MHYFWKVWAVVGWVAYRLLSFSMYWLVSGSTRVRVQILNGQKILLVKEWLGDGRWRLPGGGIKPDETPEQASSRELDEELGLRFKEGAFKIGDTRVHKRYLSHYSLQMVSLFLDSEPEIKLNRKEINQSEWFLVDSPEAKQALINPN